MLVEFSPLTVSISSRGELQFPTLLRVGHVQLSALATVAQTRRKSVVQTVKLAGKENRAHCARVWLSFRAKARLYDVIVKFSIATQDITKKNKKPTKRNPGLDSCCQMGRVEVLWMPNPQAWLRKEVVYT